MFSRLISSVRHETPHDNVNEELKYNNGFHSSSMLGLSYNSHALHTINQAIREKNSQLFSDLLSTTISNHDLLNHCDQHGYSPLHYAASVDAVDIAKKLLHKKANVNNPGSEKVTPLHIAVKYNSTNVISLLLEKRANINARSHSGMTPLHFAARKGHENSVRARGIDTGVTDDNGISPLHLAMLGGNLEVCRMMVALQSTTILAVAADGRTPMHFAASAGFHQMMEFLINNASSADCTGTELINKADGVGNTVLHLAVQYGHQKATDVCLSNGVNLNELSFNLSTALHLAAQNGHDQILMSLIKAGARLNIEDANGFTPLNRAAVFGRKNTVECLVKEGAIVNFADNEGFTPLMNGCRKGHCDIVDFLLNNGANVEICDGSERNCLHWATLSCNMEIVKLLIDVAGKPLLDKADRNGLTPLHYAAEEGNNEMLTLFLQNGANASGEDDEEHTPLHLAALQGHINCISGILAVDSSMINVGNIKGQTPLHLASKRGHGACIKLLLQHGADVTRTDDYRLSPLNYTAVYGFHDSMNILLESKASINTIDRYKNTPLHLAAKHGNTKVIQLLLDNGADITLLNDHDQSCLDVAIENRRSEAAISFVKHKRWREVLENFNGDKEPPLRKLIEVLPEAAKVVLDQCIVSSPLPEKHPNYTITFNYRYIDPDPTNPQESQKRYPAMKDMVKNDREELLNHPLCQSLLRLKWRLYGRSLFIINLLSYVFFLTMLTTFVAATSENSYYLTFNCTDCCNTSIGSQYNKTLEIVKVSNTIQIIKYITFGFTCFGLLKEIAQIFQQGSRYINFENLLEWVLYFSTFLYMFPFSFVDGVDFFGNCPPIKIQLLWGSIAIVLAWINMLLYFKRFAIGIYVVMFVTVLKNVIKVLILFTMFIIGFALSFFRVVNSLKCASTNGLNSNCTLHRPSSVQVFKTPAYSMVKVFIMMQGEFDFTEDFVTGAFSTNPAQQLTYPYFTFGIFVVFLIAMSIVLMNLLVGLAVGDIETVRRYATLSRIKRQVESFEDVESRLTKGLLQLVYRSTYVAKPNAERSAAYKFFKAANKKIDEYTSEYIHSREQDKDTHLITYFRDEITQYKRRIAKLHSYMIKQTDILVKINKKLTKMEDGKGGTLQQKVSTIRQRPTSPAVITDDLIAAAKSAELEITVKDEDF